MLTITSPTNQYNWIPSANPIVYTISTTTTYSRLSYIIDVYVNGAVVAQLKYPVYDRSRLNVDLLQIVNDYISTDFTNDDILSGSNTLIYETNEVASVNLCVTEEYFDGASMVIDSGNQKYGREVYVWRSAADFPKYRQTSKLQDDLFLTPAQNRPKFLGTKWDGESAGFGDVMDWMNKGNPQWFSRAYPVSMNSIGVVSFGTFGANVISPNRIAGEFFCFCFDGNLNNTKYFSWKNPDTYTTTDYTKKVSHLPYTPTQLNLMPWTSTTLVTGVNAYIDPDEDKYYCIYWNNPSVGRGIKPIPFEIVPCNQFDTYSILYKTTEGGWWQIRADRKNQKSTEVKTSVKFNTLGVSANQPIPNDWRAKEVVHTEGNGSITLNTDWLNGQWLVDEVEDMIVSPSIFLIKEGINPVYIPVLLKDTTTRIYNKKQDKLIQYSFEFEESFKKPTLI